MSSSPKKTLNLFDSTCLIVGIIIGAGLFETAPAVASAAGSSLGVYLFWTLGGLISLAGALCYAELATAYPQEGGDYVYLTRAYGRWSGFLFGWIQLVVARPGDVAMMAFIFARYAMWLIDPSCDVRHGPGLIGMLALACGAVILLTGINILGVRLGKWTQNILTIVKILGVGAILAGALFVEPAAGMKEIPTRIVGDHDPTIWILLAIALIRVLYTYGGWNEMAYVAAEVKRPDRNILRALLLGTISVTGLYLLLNGAFIHVLGLEQLAKTNTVGVDFGNKILPVWGGRFLAALICVSALGAVNGLIFAGARISYALGSDHRLFAVLGRWNAKTGTPIASLAIQAILAVSMIIAFGSFDRTILVTSVAVYTFYMATSLAVIVLRRREPEAIRPYRVTGYPVVPLLFAASCVLLIYGAWDYRPMEAYISASILLAGLPVYWISVYVGERKGIGD